MSERKPSDDEYIRQGRAILRKIDKRIESLAKERSILSKQLESYISGIRSIIKVCPFCGNALNPFTDRPHPYATRTYKCSKCGKRFTITLHKKEFSMRARKV